MRCVIVSGSRVSISCLRISCLCEVGPGNGVNRLYKFAQGRLLRWEIEDLLQDLADLIGCPVNLVSRNALHLLIRKQVFEDTEAFYRAT